MVNYKKYKILKSFKYSIVLLIVLLRYSVAQSGALKQLKPGAGLFVVQTRLMPNVLDHEQRKYAPLPRICGCWT